MLRWQTVHLALVLVIVATAAACSDGSPASPPDAGERPVGYVQDAGVGMIDIVVGELQFDARVEGPETGEVVILLHGFPETSYQWRSQLTALANAGYRAVAPDQRGYSAGARPPNVDDYTLALLAQDVLDMADALGAARFHIVGHDWGGFVAWFVASIASDRLLSLTALSVPHLDAFASQLADQRSCQRSASAYVDGFRRENSEEQLVSFGGTFFRTVVLAGVEADASDEYFRVLGSEEAMSAALNWYRANVSSSRLVTVDPIGPIEVPTLYIWSDDDHFVCREGADATQRYVVGDYRFEVLEGVSHWITDEAPDEVNALLLPHLAEHGANAHAGAGAHLRSLCASSPSACR